MARSWYERHVLLLVYVQQVGIVREEDRQGHVVHDVLSGLVAVGVRHAGRGIQHPFVQGRKTVVENMLVPLGLTMGSHGFGPPTEKGVSGIQGRHQIQVLGPQVQVGILSLLRFPLAFPLFHHHVPASTNTLGPLDRARVQLVGRGPVEFVVALVSLGVTFGAPVVETAVEFVHEPGARIAAVPVVAMLAHPKEHFASVTAVAKAGFTVRGGGQDPF